MQIDSIEAIVLDFDGVLTDNRVFVDQDGREMVVCNRGDGLAFDVLRGMDMHVFILSTETNPVVRQRGEKLRIPVYQGMANKVQSLKQLTVEIGFDLAKTLYIGNDLNDYGAMELCGLSACPADSHPRILHIADIVLKRRGGDGIVREVVEDVLGIDPLTHLY